VVKSKKSYKFFERQSINPYFVDASAMSSLRWSGRWRGFMAAACVAGRHIHYLQRSLAVDDEVACGIDESEGP
jgi:hypothetical protein